MSLADPWTGFRILHGFSKERPQSTRLSSLPPAGGCRCPCESSEEACACGDERARRHAGSISSSSGLALHHAITMPNAPGTIDPGYRGEVRVILLNLGREPYTIHAGDRIAQMIVARYEAVEWE